jgi:DHA3 family macrolide efflux protein-like MFS transporter
MKTDWKKNAALFISGQALSYIGTMVVQYAIFWHITLKSRSGSMMTLFAVIGLLPMCAIAPFAGVWADRFDRKRIINVADASVALFSLITAILLTLGIDGYAMLFVCAFVRAIGTGVQTPTVSAFIPLIVPREHLTRVNGIQSSIQSLVALATPVFAATLMAAAPLQTLFLVDVATAAVGISIVIFFVKIPRQEQAVSQPEQQNAGYLSEFREGLRYVREHGYLLRLITVSAAFMFLAAPAGLLTPLQAARKFGGEVWRLSAIEVAFSSGMMAGGILIGTWGGLKKRVHTMALSCALCGLLDIALGLAPSFWLYLAVMAMIGIAIPLYNAPSMALIQSTVAPAFMGRVLSVFTMATGAMMPVGMLLFGPLADIIHIDTLLIVTGALTTLLCVFFFRLKTG